MKMTLRWYGESDPVSVRYISQIPTVTGVVSAVYDVPPGEVWSVESIKRVRSAAEKAGLEFEVVESVPVHEDIKLGKPTRDKYIEVYKENIRRLGKAGIKFSRNRITHADVACFEIDERQTLRNRIGFY